MCLYLDHAQQMVFRPDVIKKLTKQMETKTLLIYVWESRKSFLIFLFKLILMFLWKKKKVVEIRSTDIWTIYFYYQYYYYYT